MDVFKLLENNKKRKIFCQLALLIINIQYNSYYYEHWSVGERVIETLTFVAI